MNAPFIFLRARLALAGLLCLAVWMFNPTPAVADDPIDDAMTIMVQAEDYIAAYDKTPGNAGGHYRNGDVDIWWYHPDTYYVGSNSTGERLEYTIDAPAWGRYRIELRVASPNTGRRLRLDFEEMISTGSLTVPNTGGWTTWQTLQAEVSLEKGWQTMLLVVESGGMNIDWIRLVSIEPQRTVAPTILPHGGAFANAVEVRLGTPTEDATIYYTLDGSDSRTSATRMVYAGWFTLTADATVRACTVKAGLVDSDEAVADFIIREVSTITIQAEDYDPGRPRVAYYDKTPGNAGGRYRTGDVDIWWYPPNAYYVGSNSTGEWLNYTIAVPLDGLYRLDLRVATPNSGRRVHVEVDGLDRSGPLTVPATGGWTTWKTLEIPVFLREGRQTVTLVVDLGGFNIDRFSLTYLDRENVCEEGYFVVRNEDDLVRLSNCTAVRGFLIIEGGLASLDGQGNLKEIQGDLIIQDNDHLVNLRGVLDNLARVSGNIEVRYNASLENVEGLEKLKTVLDSVTLIGNPALTTLNGLDGLEMINGNLEIWFHANLETLEGLNRLVRVGQSLVVWHNDRLESLEGLNSLPYVGDINKFNCREGWDCEHSKVIIEGNGNLTSLAGLTRLAGVFGELDIHDNDRLTTLAGLNGEGSFFSGSLSIRENDRLADLDGLSHLTAIEGQLRVQANDSLVSIGPLNRLTSIGALLIRENPALAALSLSGLNNAGWLEICGNPVLPQSQVVELRDQLLRRGGIYYGVDVGPDCP